MNNRPMACLLVLLLTLAVGGCSEERYGLLACSGPVDTLVVYPRMEFQQITVIPDTSATSDHDPGMAGMGSLYLGSDGETSSDILVNLDFSDIFSEDYPETLFTESNIRSVKLSLHRLSAYTASSDSSTIPRGLVYQVKALDQPFDSKAYQMWPGGPPAMEGQILNSDFSELNYSDEPFLRLYPDVFFDWVRNRDTVGIVIHAANGSEEGLVGFASREFTEFWEIGPIGVGTVVAPSILVEFNNYIDDNRFMSILPVNDSSTFHSLASPPPELALVQTGLRSYPVLTYDIPQLSSDTCILDMTFRIAAKELDPFHQFHNLSLHHMNPDSSGWSTGTIMEENFYDASRDLTQLAYDRSDAGNPVFFTSGSFIRHFYPLPESMHLMFGFESIYNFSSSLYFAQSTFYGPGAEPEYRPVILFLTRKKVD